MLQRAAEDAVSPEHITAIVRRAVRSALEGNLAAAKLVLERVCGRAPDAKSDSEPLGLTLPNLKTSAGCTAAIDKVVEAITAGTVDVATAKVLLDAVHARLKAIEVTDLEQRLADLEKAAESVDLGKGRNMRRI